MPVPVKVKVVPDSCAMSSPESRKVTPWPLLAVACSVTLLVGFWSPMGTNAMVCTVWAEFTFFL